MKQTWLLGVSSIFNLSEFYKGLANEIFLQNLLLSPPDDVFLSKIPDFCHFLKIVGKKGEIESNFLNTPIGGLKLNHYLV